MGIFRSTRSRARLVPTMPSCALEGPVPSGAMPQPSSDIRVTANTAWSAPRVA